MNTILYELCHLLYDIPDDFYKREDVIRQSKKTEKIKLRLLSSMDEEKKQLLERLIEEMNLYDSLECFEYFSQGVRCGMKLYEELKKNNVDQENGIRNG